MQLLRLTDRESRLHSAAMNILRESISGAAQLPEQSLGSLLADGKYQLFAYALGEDVQGMALVYFSREQPFAWLDYFAIRPDLRGRGLGSDLFRTIAQLAIQQEPPPRWLLLEVDDDREGNSQHQATCARRVEFYRRLGARLVENVPYRFPSAFTMPLPMRLMAYSLRADAMLTQADLGSAVREIFEEIHGRGPGDDLLRWFYSNLPGEIEMK